MDTCILWDAHTGGAYMGMRSPIVSSPKTFVRGWSPPMHPSPGSSSAESNMPTPDGSFRQLETLHGSNDFSKGGREFDDAMASEDGEACIVFAEDAQA